MQMGMRIIDAVALDMAFTELRFDEKGEIAHWGDRKDWCMRGCDIEKLIADAPTVDAIPVEWLRGVAKNLKENGCLNEARVIEIAVDVWNGEIG